MSLTDHQIFMLKHFAMGWKFKQYNDKPGSWNTYWSLRRRNLIKADSVVTKKGREVLSKELELQAARQAKREARQISGSSGNYRKSSEEAHEHHQQ